MAWGFRCHLQVHVRKGYSIVIMTNGDSSGKSSKSWKRGSPPPTTGTVLINPYIAEACAFDSGAQGT
jgi:hypothetical protein